MDIEIEDKFGRKIRLTDERYKHIIEKHPEIKDQEEKIKETLRKPELVKKSVYSNDVLIFYKYYKQTPVTEKYLTVGIKLLNGEGFVVTVYFTDRIKEGEIIWKED